MSGSTVFFRAGVGRDGRVDCTKIGVVSPFSEIAFASPQLELPPGVTPCVVRGKQASYPGAALTDLVVVEVSAAVER